MRFLTVREMLVTHHTLLRAFGGESGVSHRGGEHEGVLAVVGAVRNAYYEYPQEFAAAYAICIVAGHIFLDGNKRAGGGCAIAFLKKNGISSRLPAGALQPLMLELQQRSERGERAVTLLPWLARKL